MKQSDSERTDEALALAAQGGDAESMDELMERFKPFVKSRARGFFLLGGDSEDVVQEGMIGLFKAIRDYDADKGAFSAFAKVCIFRQVCTAIKLAGRNKHVPLNNYVPLAEVEDIELPEKAENPEEVVIRLEDAERFSASLEEMLSPLEYGIVADYLEGMRYEEIAAKQGVSKKAIDNALQRIRRKCQRGTEKGNAQARKRRS